MTDTEQWRAILVSTKDIEFKSRQITIEAASEKPVKIDVPDMEIICNGCNRNQYPDNIWRLEYKDGHEWQTYDVYCDDCCEQYFPNADLISVGIRQ